MTMDIMNISNEEIGELVKNDPNMMMYLGLTSQVKELSNELEKIKADQHIHKSKLETHENNISKLNTSQNETVVKVDKIVTKVDVYKHDDSGQFAIFKSTALARVHKLVGKPGSIEYILFYAPFALKIYRDISDQLGVANSGNIRMLDSEKAIKLAKSWNPALKYVKGKIYEYQRKDGLSDKAKEKLPNLVKERLAVLDDYLNKTNGGTNIEF